ncbi:hypothetical protein ACXZ1K_06435 [Pedobacter sp. PWIIR3]
MGAADDFVTSFFKEYPQAQSGKLSMEELNALMTEYQRKINSSPLADFDGLSPEDMEALLHSPFAPGSVLQFSKEMDYYVDQVPIFKLSELLINEIRNAGILKLTTKSNLPVRVCEMLYNQELIKWEYMEFNKKIREDEVPYLWPLKQYLLGEGIVKKRNNAMSLTKHGEKLMEGPKAVRFVTLLTYFTDRFYWGNFYGLEDGGKYGNLGWAYSLVLLSKYGSRSNTAVFYSFKLIRAFEKGLWNAHQKDMTTKACDSHHSAYTVRFFECFANWFGLIKIERTRDYKIPLSHQVKITKSSLFDHLFEVIKG